MDNEPRGIPYLIEQKSVAALTGASHQTEPALAIVLEVGRGINGSDAAMYAADNVCIKPALEIGNIHNHIHVHKVQSPEEERKSMSTLLRFISLQLMGFLEPAIGGGEIISNKADLRTFIDTEIPPSEGKGPL